MSRNWIAILLAGMLIGGAGAQEPRSGDENITDFDPRPAVAELTKVIADHGGDPDHHSVRLVIAFATGNASQDPARAHAMRSIAQQLLNRFLVSGDTERPAGFEMTPWTIGEERPFTSVDRPALWSEWPKSPMPRSIGGTDYYAALSGLLPEVAGPGRPDNWVIVMLGPFEGGVAPQGTRLHAMSSASPVVAREMASARCAPLESFSFTYRQPSRGDQRMVWMHVAVPERFGAQPLPEDTRTGWLARRQGWYPADDPYRTVSGSAPAAPETDNDTPLWIALGLLAALVAAGLFWRARRAPGPGRRVTLTVSVEGRGKRELAGPFKPGPICRLVGAGFPEIKDADIEVGEKYGVPTLILAEVHAAGRGVRLLPGAAAVYSDGQLAPSGLDVAPGAARKVRLRGRHVPTDGRPARDFDIGLDIGLT